MAICFERSSDFPVATTPFTTSDEEALDPPPFLPPLFEPCNRVSILDRTENDVIWTKRCPAGMEEKANTKAKDDDDSFSDSEGDEGYFDDESDEDEETELQDVVLVKQGGEEAYWLQRSLRDAIYGKIRYGLSARRRKQVVSSLDKEDVDVWDITNQRCAVKEIARERVQRKRRSCKEDPFKVHFLFMARNVAFDIHFLYLFQLCNLWLYYDVISFTVDLSYLHISFL